VLVSVEIRVAVGEEAVGATGLLKDAICVVGVFEKRPQ
jgi:hypothetical protein